MKNKPSQVVGLGQCCLDYIGAAPFYPDPNTKCELSQVVIQGGGPVATALVALSRWGLSCSLIGITGDDDFGVRIRESLEMEKIDTSGIIIRKDCGSQFAFIAAEPGSGRRTIFWQRPTGEPPSPDEVNTDIIQSAKILHVDGLFSEATLAACKSARDAGVKVSVDAGSLRPGMLDIAAISDYFIASESFAKSLANNNDPEAACRKIISLGPELACVTLGEKGYVAIHGDEVIHAPAFQVSAVDTTGCGDVFHAGFIYGMLREWSVDKSLRFAAWSAAQVASKLGGRAGIPEVEEWGGN